MVEVIDIMLSEHRLIGLDLIEILNIPSDHKNKIINALKEFKIKIQKHFLTEEKVIFSSLIGSKDIEIMFKLLNDHKIIIENLNNSINLKTININETIRLIDDHSKFETNDFYLRLENLLSSEEIKLITKRFYEFK